MDITMPKADWEEVESLKGLSVYRHTFSIYFMQYNLSSKL